MLSHSIAMFPQSQMPLLAVVSSGNLIWLIKMGRETLNPWEVLSETPNTDHPEKRVLVSKKSYKPTFFSLTCTIVVLLHLTKQIHSIGDNAAAASLNKNRVTRSSVSETADKLANMTIGATGSRRHSVSVVGQHQQLKPPPMKAGWVGETRDMFLRPTQPTTNAYSRKVAGWPLYQ